MRDYGGAIRKLRKYYEYTQQQLAKKLNVSYQAVSKWENNTNQIDLDTMQKMCEVFGVTVDNFMRISEGAAVNDVIKGNLSRPTQVSTVFSPEPTRVSDVPLSQPAPESAATLSQPTPVSAVTLPRPTPVPTVTEPESVAATADLSARKKIDTTPIVIIASSLLAVIITAVIVTCVLFIPRKLSQDRIYATVNPSVFSISVDTDKAKKGGTGFFIDDSGTAVTNYHVLSDGTDAQVTLYNGKKYKIDKILGVDGNGDIVIFHVDIPKSQAVKFADSNKIKTGDKVYALGYPEAFVYGVDSSTFADGIVSKASYNIAGINYIQTDTDLLHGNSGGVLVNDKGRVIGFTTGKLDFDGVNHKNFALPINNVNKVKREYSCTLKEYTATHRTVTVKLMDGGNVFWKKTVPQNERLNVPDPTRTGYDFDGWYGDKNFNAKAEVPTVSQSDITLYGKWTPHTYTLKFDSDGGEGSMTSISLKYDQQIRLPSCDFTKDGKFFSGWKCGGVVYFDRDYVLNLTDKDGDVLVLTAVWRDLGVKMSFDLGGAEGEMSDVVLAKGEKCILPKCGVTRHGYVFNGWEYGGRMYTAGDEIVVLSEPAEITVTAQWVGYSYTIRFVNPNGASTMPDLKVDSGESVKLPKSTYKNGGRPMLYWTCRDPDTTAWLKLRIDDGETVKDLANYDGEVVVLTACWAHIDVNFELDPDGGYSYSTGKYINFRSDESFRIDSFGFAKTGYYLSGWEIEGKVYGYGDTFTVRSYKNDVYKAKAVWTPYTYYINYSCLDDDDSGLRCVHRDATDVFVYNESGYVFRNPFDESGHPGFEFKEIELSWADKSWQPGEKLDIYDHTDIRVFVKWRPKLFRNVIIEMENDEGMETYSGVYAWTYGKDILSEIRSLVDFGKIENKSAHSVSSCKVYVNGNEYSGDLRYPTTDTDAEIRVVVAQTMNSYTLELVPLYSTTDEVTLRYDEYYTLPTPEGSVGQVFQGWSIGDNVFEAGSRVNKLAESGRVTARGKWGTIEYTVEYDVDGDKDTVDSKKVKYDQTFVVADYTYYKSGYVFLAWECGENVYIPGSSVKNLTAEDGATVTLKAKWGVAYEGRGTEESPYRVSSYEQLFNLHLFVARGSNKNAFYKLTADIDCENKPLYPIGMRNYVFGGVFDGGYHVISNAVLKSGYPNGSKYYVGMFGTISGGTVKNLGIDNYAINATGNIYVGALAGRMSNYDNGSTKKEAHISGVWANGSIDIVSDGYVYVGGLIGDFTGGTAENCYSQGTISIGLSDPDGFNSIDVGGFAGNAGYSQSYSSQTAYITHCYADMKITASTPADGASHGLTLSGFIGEIRKASVNSSFVAGSITVTGRSYSCEFGYGSAATTDGFVFVSEQYKITQNGEEVPLSAKYKKEPSEKFRSSQWLSNTLEWDTDEVWTVSENAFPTLRGFERKGEAQ